jgi:HTH-type transcriptional regulator, cell division transcriptional repressor
VKPEFPDQATRNHIGVRTRQARRSAQPRVSQLDLVARVAEYGVNLTQAMLSKIEQGKRSVTDKEVRAIAAALYVPVSWLIAEDEVWGSTGDIPPWPKRR